MIMVEHLLMNQFKKVLIQFLLNIKICQKIQLFFYNKIKFFFLKINKLKISINYFFHKNAIKILLKIIL